MLSVVAASRSSVAEDVYAAKHVLTDDGRASVKPASPELTACQQVRANKVSDVGRSAQ